MSQVRGLRALTWAYLLETWRSKPAIFWNLVFPVFSLIGFSYIFGHGEAAGVTRIVPGICLLYTSPSPRDRQKSRMPSSA